MAEDRRELALGIEARQRVGVRVADARRHHLHEHLAGLRAFDADGLDGERLAGLPRHGGPGFHARVLLMIRSGDYVKPRVMLVNGSRLRIPGGFTDRAELHMSASANSRRSRLVPDVRAAIIPVTPFQQNCTLLWCEKTKKAAVVDPGGDLERIRDAIAQSGVERGEDHSDPRPYRSRGRSGGVAGRARRAGRGTARGGSISCCSGSPNRDRPTASRPVP